MKEKINITIQAITDGDGRDSSSFKDRRSFEVQISRAKVAELLDKCEQLFEEEFNSMEIIGG